MGTLDNLLLQDSATSFDDWGEAARIRQKGCGARDIIIIVDRNAASPIPGTTDGFSPHVDVWIRNDKTLGITKLTKGGDTLEFSPRLGDEVSFWPITELIDQDAGLWHVRIRTNR